MNCRCHIDTPEAKRTGFVLQLWQVFILKSKLIYDDI